MNDTDVRKRWSFPWPIMKVLLGGRSSVDLAKLGIKTDADARAFLKSYGFDPATERDRRKMHAVFVEALTFIETQLMPREWSQGQRPPEAIISCTDPAQLLVWASERDVSQPHRRLWACALLKVMHTITHIDDLQRLNNLEEARSQIMERFQRAIFRDREGVLWFGAPGDCIRLERVEWKLVKTRNSIILKLLHKPGNVAENIYDLVGVRLVTTNLSETMIAVKFLRQFNLVDFPNTVPARARNNLIDMDQFQIEVRGLKQQLKERKIDAETFTQRVSSLKVPKRRGQATNPHSSANYRAIQLTCRQRVRYPNPLMTWQEKVKAYITSHELNKEESLFFASLFTFVEKWQRHAENDEIAVFFPFEVQILDREAASLVEAGDASHDRYKRSQVRTARRRILHDVLNLPAL